MMLRLPTGEKLRYEGNYRFVLLQRRTYGKGWAVDKVKMTNSLETLHATLRRVSKGKPRSWGHFAFDTRGEIAVLIDPATGEPIEPSDRNANPYRLGKWMLWPGETEVTVADLPSGQTERTLTRYTYLGWSASKAGAVSLYLVGIYGEGFRHVRPEKIDSVHTTFKSPKTIARQKGLIK